MTTLRSWEKKVAAVEDSIDVTDSQVVIGHEAGFGHGSSGASCSREEFLGGKLNELVENTFGHEILAEVLAFLRSA